MAHRMFVVFRYAREWMNMWKGWAKTLTIWTGYGTQRTCWMTSEYVQVIGDSVGGDQKKYNEKCEHVSVTQRIDFLNRQKFTCSSQFTYSSLCSKRCLARNDATINHWILGRQPPLSRYVHVHRTIGCAQSPYSTVNINKYVANWMNAWHRARKQRKRKQQPGLHPVKWHDITFCAIFSPFKVRSSVCLPAQHRFPLRTTIV